MCYNLLRCVVQFLCSGVCYNIVVPILCHIEAEAPLCFEVCVTMRWGVCYNFCKQRPLVVRCVLQLTDGCKLQTINCFKRENSFRTLGKSFISGVFHFNFVIKILSFFQVPHVHFEIVLRLQADINAAAVRNEMYCPAITENKICKMRNDFAKGFSTRSISKRSIQISGRWIKSWLRASPGGLDAFARGCIRLHLMHCSAHSSLSPPADF